MATREATGIPAPMVQMLMMVGSLVQRCINAHTRRGITARRMGSIGQMPFSVLISFKEAAAMEAPIMIMDNGVVMLPTKPTHS